MALVKEHFPTAWFFVKNILQTQNLWFFGGEDGIRSFKMKDGILQGDPMSMLLYCISIMPMIKGIDEILKEHNGFTCWYADDGGHPDPHNPTEGQLHEQALPKRSPGK